MCVTAEAWGSAPWRRGAAHHLHRGHQGGSTAGDEQPTTGAQHKAQLPGVFRHSSLAWPAILAIGPWLSSLVYSVAVGWAIVLCSLQPPLALWQLSHGTVPHPWVWLVPRQVSRELVDAYMARRALDYLVGFGISPVLWRRLPGARSAGDEAAVGRGRLLGVSSIGQSGFQLQAFSANAVPAYCLCVCYFSSARGTAMLVVRDDCCHVLAAVLQGACNPWHCGWHRSARTRSTRSSPKSIGALMCSSGVRTERCEARLYLCIAACPAHQRT